MNGWLETESGTTRGIVDLLQRLLSEGIVDALLVPLRTPDGRAVVPTLIRDPSLLSQARPLAPVLPINAGMVLGQITATGPAGRVGAVLRNCELRTVVELSKVRQALLDDVLLIGVDCLGTYAVEDYADLAAEGIDPVSPALAMAGQGTVQPLEGRAFRAACTMCERPIPSAGRGAAGGDDYAPHVAIGLLGVPNDQRLWLSVPDPDLAAVLGIEPADEPVARDEAIASLIADRTAERDRRFVRFAEQVSEPLSLLSEFATCIRCQNCMVACPICYCKECIFRTDIFHHPSARYWDWAARKGAVRLPSDTLLFHVTRMLHMAHACVGCGMCSDACPVDIPVADVFRAVGQRVQQRFDYVPGRHPDEEMVIATFREDELKDLGG